MSRALEAISRRIYRLLIIVFLIPLASLAVTYFLVPRTYQAQASLWALHRYTVIGATGPESNLQDTPANTQATALQELLQTRAFALKIAHGVNLAPSLHLGGDVLANPQKLDDALYTDISHNVTVAAGGYNLYVISYANRDAQMAQQVVTHVVSDFSTQSSQFSTDEAQTLLSSYQTLLQKAQDTERQASSAEVRYLADHPKLSTQDLANDPQYQSLHSATLQAETNVQGIQQEISSIQQQITAQGSGSSNLFTTVDVPHTLDQPVSRTKTYLLVGTVSLIVGLLACIIYLLIVLRRDRSIYTYLDLQKVTALPVLMQLPHLTSPSVPFLIQANAPLLDE
ncbi:MAG TPA: hypothetical protein VGD98_21085 [Ktedonobacteraceae bacterium]